MNKNKFRNILCIVFVLQLLIPVCMISYSHYIDWGLRERAAVYKVEVDQLEYYVNSNSVYLADVYYFDGVHKKRYASVKTGADGFAVFELSGSKPDGNYIRSQSDGSFVFPIEGRYYELQEPIEYDGEGNWLYMINNVYHHKWGYGSENPPVCFESAYAVIRVFKGYVRLDGVFVDGQRVEVFIQQQLDEGAFVE